VLVMAILCPVCIVPAEQKEEDPGQLTLKRIFTDREFSSKGFSARWSMNGNEYTYLKDAEGKDKGKDIRVYNVAESRDSVMVKASELFRPGTQKQIEIEDYSFSRDRSLVMIYTNSKRVWRRNSRGDYWVLDRSSGEFRKIGGEAKASTLQFAKFSPDGKKVAYVRERNIYVEDLLDHSIRALTKTKSKDIINGTADWVYEEELGVRDGFRWSPGSDAIAYWQFDERGVRKHTMIDNVSGLYPKLTSFGYPKVGQRNSACRVGVRSLSSEETVWVKSSEDLRNNYIARMHWSKRSGGLIIEQLDRAQETNSVMRVNVEDGSINVILTESDEAWVDAHREMNWVGPDKRFTWISDRDGWRHVYMVSAQGKKIDLVSPGKFDVIRLLRTDHLADRLYFIASPDDPAQRYLYSVRTDGTGLKRVTPAEHKRGTHSYNISPNGKYAILRSSDQDTVPVTSLISLPDHKVIKVLENNEELKEKFAKVKKSPSEFFYVDIGDGNRLHSRCIKPPNFDPQGKYPLLVYVYGEPAGQVVRDSWGGSTHLWHLMLAQQGYVIMSFDNRGTAAPRGREWRKAADGKIGILPPQDQAEAVRRVLKDRPYLDPSRVGSWGWSGGGSMSLNAIFKFPDLYNAAIAVASVPNQRHYDTIYQERYMGLPGDNLKGFREGSPINFAHQLKGDLLIVHGAADDNCHYQTFEKLIDKLVSHNKPFTMMTYPRGTHSIREGKNTTLHLYTLMTSFLKKSLEPTGPDN
ncbi:MAG: S9 family peptidase, partial [Verrucomicrobiales bacterium]|nr:S9 family peptidase [Verrucomicrobiales bacterium]